ncbi:hypothetical protein [Pseudomonas mangiferae]|uniref:Uncharacterized protein n=1 Tax=Pseudomonas mangiferae TaxID=2593654 RepID=A0A553GZP5_9PSED|nr:hypothetical protein [Pseudomonas mangiferae]TRX74974.1 hypothetical protein FM069_10635 [Pseudomonas mangiferae]
MAYFTLNTEVGFPAYPFDFHSHFAGILPVESDVRWKPASFTFTPKSSSDKHATLDTGQELSLVGLLIHENPKDYGQPTVEEKRQAAHYHLFDLALARMMGPKNPFRAYDKDAYLRGECAAESVYLACVILLRRFGLCVTHLAIERPDVYQTTQDLLRDLTKRDERTGQLVRYFNRKIWSANKYTPFDDAYWMRGAIRDLYPLAFAVMTAGYLYGEGITHTQTATGADEIPLLNDLFVQFNQAWKTHYTLLAHTAHGYTTKKLFAKDLDTLIDLFEQRTEGAFPYATLVGLDLLGMETATGFYAEFFKVLQDNRAVFEAYLEKPVIRQQKVVLHIHCGEGTGVSNNNRSLCGYFLRNSSLIDPAQFYPALVDHAYTSYRNTLQEADAKARERGHAPHRKQKANPVGELFDELFHDSSLTVGGLQVQRFDITSATTQSLVAYYARSNIMNLCNALEVEPGQSVIKSTSPFTVRIGHGYYYRNYVAARFPQVTFDTNLGSNFITGASGLFDSANAYRLNRGLRHLNGYVDTDTLEATTTAISYLNPERMTVAQLTYLHDMSSRQEPDDNDKEIFHNVAGRDVPEWVKKVLQGFFFHQIHLCEITGKTKQDNYIRYRLYRTLFAIVLNWRSYLLGADGQGVEHSNVQDEAVRMTLLLAYALYRDRESVPHKPLEALYSFLIELAKAYWRITLNDIEIGDRDEPRVVLKRFEGFESPDSVVLIRTERHHD